MASLYRHLLEVASLDGAGSLRLLSDVREDHTDKVLAFGLISEHQAVGLLLTDAFLEKRFN